MPEASVDAGVNHEQKEKGPHGEGLFHKKSA
jgi:hypothetical protein